MLLMICWTVSDRIVCIFRLKNVEMLCNFFRSVIILSPDDLLQCMYLCLNKIAPAYEGVELGIGDTVLIKALAEATGWFVWHQRCVWVMYPESVDPGTRRDVIGHKIKYRIQKKHFNESNIFNNNKKILYC